MVGSADRIYVWSGDEEWSGYAWLRDGVLQGWWYQKLPATIKTQQGICYCGCGERTECLRVWKEHAKDYGSTVIWYSYSSGYNDGS